MPPRTSVASRLARAASTLMLLAALAACGSGGSTDVGSDAATGGGASAGEGGGNGDGAGSGAGGDGGQAGGDDGGAASGDDGSDGAGAGTTPPGSGPGEPPVDLSLGLNRRPANSACVAPGEPGGGIVREQPMYANLPFEGAILNLEQPRGQPGHWYAHTRQGGIYRFRSDGDGSDAQLLLDLGPRLAGLQAEGGLIGMALDPQFPANGHVYVNYTVQAGRLQSVISRMTMAGGRLDPASELVVQRIDHPTPIHLAGRMAFGPDGLLYVAVGDANYGDSLGLVQDPEDLHGKLLRYDVRAARPGAPFEVPPGNPHRGNPACTFGTSVSDCPEWFATGLRNPWRFSFDRASATPDIWLSDVGHAAWEEINRIGPGGGNFGWNIREGSLCFGGGSGCPTFSPEGERLIGPVYEYPNDGFAAAVGGFVYRGTALPSLAGDFVFADYARSQIYVLRPTDNGYRPDILIQQTPANPVGFAEDAAGELYFLGFAPTGTRIFKLVPSDVSGDSVPERLSETGCVVPGDPKRVGQSMVPYAPKAPFWSDGLDKSRWLAIPDGTRIEVGPDGQFVFPPGSVVMKTFRQQGRLVETRLFMRHADTGNWAGYSYRWNDEQTDAFRVAGPLTTQIGGQTWTFPSGSQCQQCHTVVGGKTLGTELSQLDSAMTYDATGRTAHQLATLTGLGMLAPTQLAPTPRVDPYDETQPLAARARSWLDSNCSQCHADQGPLPTRIDLRLETPVAQAGYCNAPPADDLGMSGILLVRPGSPERSSLYLRAMRRDGYQMPPVGSHRIDQDGERLLAQWIRAMDDRCQ